MEDIWIVLAVGIIVVIAVGAIAIFVSVVSPFHCNCAPLEGIDVTNEHIWVTTNGTGSVAGFVVESVGSKPATFGKLTVRGQLVPASSWYFNKDPSVATAANMARELAYDDSLESIDITGDGVPEQFTQLNGTISLKPGEAIFVYLANPAGINASDNGKAFTMNVQAGKASAVSSVTVTKP